MKNTALKFDAMSFPQLLVFVILITCGWISAQAQCNTTLSKLLPGKSISNSDRFGSAVSSNDQFLVVAAENSDTLGILYGGAAYVYEKTPAGWAYRAMLTPSNSDEYAFFGAAVDIDQSGNTILIADRHVPNSHLYIFERPAAGWESATESVKITAPDFSSYPVAAKISDNAQTIVLGQHGTKDPAVLVYSRPANGWSAGVQPQVISGPESFFGIDVLLHDDYLYVGSDNDSDGNGIYVYKNNGSHYDLLSKLSISLPFGSTGYFGRNLTVTGDLVATTGAVFIANGDSGIKIFIYRKNSEWTSAVELAHFEIPGINASLESFHFPIQFISPTEIACSVLLRDGATYTGKVIVVKATDATWQAITSEIIFEQQGLHQRSDFGLMMHWNGTDLLRSVGTVATISGLRDAVVSLTRSGGTWGSLQHVTLDRFNSAEFQFGNKVHKTGRFLFASAPYDGTAGKSAGAVYMYEQNGQSFTRRQTLLPSRRHVRSNGTSDTGFGYSIASSETDLAISAPGYRYASDVSGRIYMYARTGAEGATLVLNDSLSPPPALMLDQVGTEMVMNDRFLFASAYNHLNNEHTNGLLIFEKINGKWLYRDLLRFAKPLDKTWPSLRLSLYGDRLLVGAAFSIDGGAFMISLNPATGKWGLDFLIEGDVFSGFGSDVKLLENHLFIGAANHPNENVPGSGAVFVYSKLPGQPWVHTMQPSVIGPQVPIEGARFGSSLDVVGNILVVGAPGSFLQAGVVRTVPGNTYIIQSKDYGWQATTEFLNLQGERYAHSEQDYFGYDVGVDRDMFYIGSNNENTEAGAFSGAVYYIPTPPVIFPVPPVCVTAGLIQLQGYPFGGTWSGNGVSDPSGKFNPALAGIGTTELTYTTPNCAFTGTVHIKVRTGPSLTLATPLDAVLCDQGSVTLKLTATEPSSYSWYFRPPGAANFSPIAGGIDGEISVAFPGEYYAAASNDLCSIESMVFTVRIESISFVISPHPVVCKHDEVIPLDIPGIEETWTGPNVANDTFNSGVLPNGTYTLTFNFTTPTGCNIMLQDSIRLNIASTVSVQRMAGDYCETGSAILKAISPDASLTYTWDHASDLSSAFVPIQKPLTATAEVFDTGYYRVRVTNGECAATSEPVEIGHNADLAFSVSPAEGSETEVCKDEFYTLRVDARPGSTFTWSFAEDAEEFTTIGSNDNQLAVSTSGHYKVSGAYGFCSFTSQPLAVRFRRDSVFVPNVFTPNGDMHNNIFTVKSNVRDYDLAVYNRDGRLMYSAPQGSWDGGEASAGVYYWRVTYAECDNARQEMKGWVQLVR